MHCPTQTQCNAMLCRAGGDGVAHQRADTRRRRAAGRRPDALLAAHALPHYRGRPEAHVAWCCAGICKLILAHGHMGQQQRQLHSAQSCTRREWQCFITFSWRRGGIAAAGSWQPSRPLACVSIASRSMHSLVLLQMSASNRCTGCKLSWYPGSLAGCHTVARAAEAPHCG